MLDGCHILVVEDEYLLAYEIQHELKKIGAVVLGPEPSVDRALARIRNEPRIDVAILDVNLGGEKVFPVADALTAKEIPFFFATGYEDSVISNRYSHVIRCDKPIDIRKLVRALKQLIS